MNTIGIYALIVKTDQGDMIYVGSTSRDFDLRRLEHLYSLERGLHYNSFLQRLYDKYRNLEFRVLEECDDLNLIVLREQYWVNQVPQRSLINVGLVISSPMLGRHHSQESKKKIGDRARGRSNSHSIEQRRKNSEAHKRGSSWNKGLHWSLEHRKKNSDGVKRYQARLREEKQHESETKQPSS